MSIENPLDTALVDGLFNELNNTPGAERLALLKKYISECPDLLKLKSGIMAATQNHSEHFNLLNLISKAGLNHEEVFALIDWVLAEYSKDLDATVLRCLLPSLSTAKLEQLWASHNAGLKQILSLVGTEEEFSSLVNGLDQAYVGISEGKGRAHWVKLDKS